MSTPKYKLGQKVKVIKHNNPRYIGLIGVVMWIGENWLFHPIYQLRTETKPPYYRPPNPEHGYIITVKESDIVLGV